MLALAFALALVLAIQVAISGPAQAQGAGLRLLGLRRGPLQDLKIRESPHGTPHGRGRLRCSALMANVGDARAATRHYWALYASNPRQSMTAQASLMSSQPTRAWSTWATGMITDISRTLNATH